MTPEEDFDEVVRIFKRRVSEAQRKRVLSVLRRICNNETRRCAARVRRRCGQYRDCIYVKATANDILITGGLEANE